MKDNIQNTPPNARELIRSLEEEVDVLREQAFNLEKKCKIQGTALINSAVYARKQARQARMWREAFMDGKPPKEEQYSIFKKFFMKGKQNG